MHAAPTRRHRASPPPGSWTQPDMRRTMRHHTRAIALMIPVQFPPVVGGEPRTYSWPGTSPRCGVPAGSMRRRGRSSPERRLRLRWQRQPVCGGREGPAHRESRAGWIAGRDDRAGGRRARGVRVDPRYHRVTRWLLCRERRPAQRSPALQRRWQLPASSAMASGGSPTGVSPGFEVDHSSRTAPGDPLRLGAGRRLRQCVRRPGRGRRAHDRGARPRQRCGGW